MKVGSTLLEQLRQRMLKNIENELRTEALLLGERYYEHNSLMAQLRPPLRPTTGRSVSDAFADSARFAMMYGSSMHTIQAIKPPEKIQGQSIPQTVLDEISYRGIEELMSKLTANLTAQTRGISAEELYLGAPDPVSEQGALARAEPNRGPQPRKPHIHRRK